MRRKLLAGAAIATAGVVLFAAPAGAQDGEGVSLEELDFLVDNLFIFVCAVLVFFMQAGFALLEAGLTRAKNVANIMMKNVTDMAAGVLAFFAVGYAIAGSGDELLGGWFGKPGWGVPGINDTVGEGLLPSTDFMFAAAFAATAATIVAGTMAERTKFRSYALFSVVLTALIYPIVVRWTWGGGWLDQLDTPFEDFAGSTVVHSTGGWAALMGAIIVGPRIGKYTAEGKARAIPGHSMAFTVLGALILFIGWFGFNPGSELAMSGNVPTLAVKTLLAAFGGAVVAAVVVWVIDGKPEVSMTANGLLAGLVSITASVDAVDTWQSIVVGAIGGLIVVLSVKMFDRLKVDDPVGAISVHGVCGAWGTLSVGFLAAEGSLIHGGDLDQLVTQVIGVAVHFVFVCVAAGAVFLGIKAVMGLRVSDEEELAGLDVEEHGSPGYGPDLLNGGGAAVAVPAGAPEAVTSGGS